MVGLRYLCVLSSAQFTVLQGKTEYKAKPPEVTLTTFRADKNYFIFKAGLTG